MKAALICDTHFGAKNDDQNFASYINDFYKNTFFPYLKKHNISHIIHLGDIMDRRKYVSYLTAQQFRKNFIEPVLENNLILDLIIGNHDTYFKHTNSLNSMRELVSGKEYKNITIIESPTCYQRYKNKVMYIPWINEENSKETFDMIKELKPSLIFGHLEIAGFGMYKGVENKDGLSSTVFDGVGMVFTGHYHHKSTKGNINYLGAPYQITWSDYDDARGFHVFDFDTYHLEYVENKNNLFEKIFYNDTKLDASEVNKMDFSNLKGKHVKVIVSEKNNPYLFDLVIEKIEKSGIAEMQVVDDHKHLDIIENEDVVDETSDTLSIINDYVSNRKELPDPDRVKKLITELYNEAMS
jgi:hypothetical protein